MTRRKRKLSGADAIPAALKKSKRGAGFKGTFLISLSGEAKFRTIDRLDISHVGLVELTIARQSPDGRGTWQKIRYTSIVHALKALAERFHVEHSE